MQPINDGDLYPNDGESFVENGVYYPKAPEGQTEKEDKAAAAQAASYPVMADIAEWFKGQVIDADSINNVQVAKMTVNGVVYSRTISVEAQVLAYQLVKEQFEAKFNEFKKFLPEIES